MKNLLFITALACASSIVWATENTIDSDTFYNTQKNKVFTEKNKNLSIGFEEGDETPFLTWEGQLSGGKLYFELHGNQITIITGRHRITANLENSFRLNDEAATGLDPRGVSLYVNTYDHPKDSVLCIESLEPDASRTTPYRSAYIITEPTTSAKLYKIPKRFASCKGLIRGSSRRSLYVPEWKFDDSLARTFQVVYHHIQPKGFEASAKPRFSGKTVDGAFDLFQFN